MAMSTRAVVRVDAQQDPASGAARSASQVLAAAAAVAGILAGIPPASRAVMSQPLQHVPAAALEALSRGDMLGAIKAVRAAGGGLKDAGAVLEAYARQQAQGGAAHAAPPAGAHVPGTAGGGMATKVVFPPEARDALARGDLMSAIKLLRAANPQLDLKTVKELVDRAHRAGVGQVTGAAAPNAPAAMRRSERVPTVMDGDGEQPVWLLFGVTLAIAGAAWWAFA